MKVRAINIPDGIYVLSEKFSADFLSKISDAIELANKLQTPVYMIHEGVSVSVFCNDTIGNTATRWGTHNAAVFENLVRNGV